MAVDVVDDDEERRRHDAEVHRESRRLGRILGFAELMTGLMVLATALSAIATWRTASIANAIYMASERPYFGVESVRLDSSKPNEPRVLVQYRNFGHLSSDDSIVYTRVMLDGAPVAGDIEHINAGILSPEVPHFIFRKLPPAKYAAIVGGKANLQVEVKATYRGFDTRRLCYFERFNYVANVRCECGTVRDSRRQLALRSGAGVGGDRGAVGVATCASIWKHSAVRCPICKRESDSSPVNRFRPFCSERCQMVDLGTWAGEGYRIAGSRRDDRDHPDDRKKQRLLH